MDLACGLGRHALWLASRSWQVSVIDVSDVAIGKHISSRKTWRLAYVGDNSTSSERPKATRDTRKVITMNPIMRRIGMPAIARRGRAKNG